MHHHPIGNNFFGRILSRIYGFGVAHYNKKYNNPKNVVQSGFHTISIGSVFAGGTGKTPLTLLIAQELLGRNFPVAIISRGYKRKSRDIVIVKPGQTIDWQTIGDEPALLKNKLHGIFLGVGGDRCAVISKLRTIIPSETIILLDDGFQHRRLARNIDIVCLPENPFNGHLIPAGYLREPFNNLIRATHICLIGPPDSCSDLVQTSEQLVHICPKANIVCLLQKAEAWRNLYTNQTATTLPLKNPTALCGIARPERFSLLLQKAGVHPSRTIYFPDHYAFNFHDIISLCDIQKAGIVTTEKDAIRLKSITGLESMDIWYLATGLELLPEHNREKFITSLLP